MLPRRQRIGYAHPLDAFRAVMIAFVFATLLVPLLQNVAPTKAASSAAH